MESYLETFIIAFVCAFGSAGWALWWGERSRNIDLRSLLTYGSLPERTQPLAFVTRKVEQADPNAMPEFDEGVIDKGAADLRAIARSMGVELSTDDARKQAIAMLQEAHGYGAS